MIKLFKGIKPKILEDNAELWTAEYVKCLDSGAKPSEVIAHRYNHTDIKDALERETNGKCAYCESKIKHIEYGDIEHILPKIKSARPDLYVDWDNLTLACEVCNRTYKRDYYDSKNPLVNPYLDNPDEYFLFIGPMITARNNNKRGFLTEETIALNRSELIVRRSERLSSINSLLFSWEHQTNVAIKNVLADQLKTECAADKEYSAFVKQFLIDKGFPKEQLV